MDDEAESMEALLEQMKREDAEGIEGRRRREAEERQRRKEEEEGRKRAAAEKRRRAAEAQARKRQQAAEQREQEKKAKAQRQEQRQEERELRRRQKFERSAKGAEWAHLPPAEEGGVAADEPSALAQAWRQRTRQARRCYKRSGCSWQGLLCLALLGAFMYVMVDAIATAGEYRVDTHFGGSGLERLLQSAGREHNSPKLIAGLRSQMAKATSNPATARSAIDHVISWLLDQLTDEERKTLLAFHGVELFEKDPSREYSTAELHNLCLEQELLTQARKDPMFAATRMAADPQNRFAKIVRGEGRSEFGGTETIVSQEQIDAAWNELSEEQQAQERGDSAWEIENQRRRKVAHNIKHRDEYLEDVAAIAEGSPRRGGPSLSSKSASKMSKEWARAQTKFRKGHPDYHWTGDWSLAVPGAREAAAYANSIRS